MQTYPMSLAMLIAEVTSYCRQIDGPGDITTTLVIPDTAESALHIHYHHSVNNWPNLRYWIVDDPTLTIAEVAMLDTKVINDGITIDNRTLIYHLSNLSAEEFALLLKYQKYVFNTLPTSIIPELLGNVSDLNMTEIDDRGFGNPMIPPVTEFSVNAKSLVDRYGEKLIDLQITTQAMGDWPGGLARVIMVWPDASRPEIVMQVANDHGYIGVFAEENVLVSGDWLKANI